MMAMGGMMAMGCKIAFGGLMARRPSEGRRRPRKSEIAKEKTSGERETTIIGRLRQPMAARRLTGSRGC
jgi:hypothetical protein